MIYIIVAILIAVVILKKGIPTLHAHWNTLIDDFEFSTKEFYALLTRELESHGINRISIKEKHLSMGNQLSGRRIYLRVRWKDYTYDCCCAPFGKGTFVSWWMFTEKTGFELLLSKIPFVGMYWVRVLFPVTYYSVDTASMFRSYTQTSVLKVIDDITKNRGIRVLSEAERKPILNDIFKR